VNEVIGHYQEEKIKDLFLGKRVVKAEGSELTLNDGTILQVIPNDGGCSCGAGDYYLDNLNKFDNIITNVEVKAVPYSDSEWESGYTYQLFVYSDGISTSVADIKGDDGNGYYGTGFEIYVKHRPAPSKPKAEFVNIFDKDNWDEQN
jgi:hypothetical protein